jgi:glycosyltransferase involved in cell wall biosynthesis
VNSLNVAIILIGTEILGGAERRIASFTRYIGTLHDLNVTLVVNSELYNQLSKASLQPMCRVVVFRSWYLEGLFDRAIRQSPGNILWKILRRVFKTTSNLFLILRFGVFLLQNKPALIHLVLGGARMIAFPFLPFIKSAMVCSVVGTEVRSFNKMWLSDRHILRWWLKKSHVVDALSEELYDILVQENMTISSKIRVSGSFVDTAEYAPLQKKNTHVVFAARLIREKNPFLFLDAIPHVLTEVGGGVRFFVLGTGNLESPLKERIREYGLQESVTMGFCDNVSEVLSESTIFCSLQENENYPSRSLLEAMSCGNAIVATDVGYTYKLVNQSTGIRVSPLPFEVASAIVKLLRNMDDTLEMGRCARRLVMDEYSPESYCGRMRNIYWEAHNIKTFRGRLE